jgi:NAD-dependent dihydropyrimidine dehydrogenase PreA subunit
VGAAFLAWTISGLSVTALVVLGVTSVASMAILSVDLAGTTPWYPSTINSFRNQFHIELDETRCDGSAECVQVCPRGVLWMTGRRHKVEIRQPDACIRCGACIVQCPADALRFRFEDGRVVEAASVRATRLNMLGRRAVVLDPAGP